MHCRAVGRKARRDLPLPPDVERALLPDEVPQARAGPDGLGGAGARKSTWPRSSARPGPVCEQHGLEPMLEIHFLADGDGLLLTYYTTDQAKMMRYTMDSFRGLLISSALVRTRAPSPTRSASGTTPSRTRPTREMAELAREGGAGPRRTS